MSTRKEWLQKKGSLLLDIFNTPIGYLSVFYILNSDGSVVLTKIRIGDVLDYENIKRHSLPNEVRSQFFEYLEGTRKEFEVQYAPAGTRFDKKVWQTLKKIPYGQTRTYQWLAEEVGSPKGARAVGGSLSRNPLPIIIPCHRIICSDGSLGGYSSGIQIKKRLLEIEFYNSVQP
jgi:methylated-DNA-[protein]-cysteine S-methyltransferase